MAPLFVKPCIGDNCTSCAMNGRSRPSKTSTLARHVRASLLTSSSTLKPAARAAPSAGLTAIKVGAAWRASSGFVHGRYWPNLRVSQPYVALQADNGINTLDLVIDEDQHRPLAHHCHSMLRRLQEHYTARPGPLTEQGSSAPARLRLRCRLA
jgi:hypothetical protein